MESRVISRYSGTEPTLSNRHEKAARDLWTALGWTHAQATPISGSTSIYDTVKYI